MKEPHPVTSEAGKVLNGMTLNSKFDVVKLTNAELDIVGNLDSSSLPSQILVGNGKYLLTNGGFFRMSRTPENRQSIGPSSLSPNSEPIPQLYRDYYAELREGSKFLWAGPSLKTGVPLREEAFKYESPQKDVPGSLAHASQPNERLAIAIVGRDKYIFTYTATKRRHGVDVN